jgi:hypothetical protein
MTIFNTPSAAVVISGDAEGAADGSMGWGTDRLLGRCGGRCGLIGQSGQIVQRRAIQR